MRKAIIMLSDRNRSFAGMVNLNFMNAVAARNSFLIQKFAVSCSPNNWVANKSKLRCQTEAINLQQI